MNNIEYSLFLIREGAIDDIDSISKFSTSRLITESSGESFIQKIKKAIAFILNKIANFFSNLGKGKGSSGSSGKADVEPKAKGREVTIELFENVYNGTFNVTHLAMKVFSDVGEHLNKTITDPHAEATTITEKYIPEKEGTGGRRVAIDNIMGEKKEFKVDAAKAKQIMDAVTRESSNFSEIHNKLKSLYGSIESKLKSDMTSEEQQQIHHKLEFLNTIAGYVFNFLSQLVRFANINREQLNNYFGKK